MPTKIIMSSILLFIAAMFIGCSGDSDKDPVESFGESIYNMRRDIVQKENLPKWLSDYVDGLGYHETVHVLHGEWRNETVYSVVCDIYSSSMPATIFYFESDGAGIRQVGTDFMDIKVNGKNWVIVYEMSVTWIWNE